MGSSSSDEFENLGMNLREFAKKRQAKVGSRRPGTPTEDTSTVDGIPKELDYVKLLNLAMQQLKRDKDAEMGGRMRISLDVRREGRKTSVNIEEIAYSLNRTKEHLVNFICNELLTTGSVNKDGRLLLAGVFLRSAIQEIIRRYIEHFVVCKVCESVGDTEIVREKKLFFLKCSKCGGARCVGNAVEGLTTKGKAKPQLRGLL